jgi:hypothetical protein
MAKQIFTRPSKRHRRISKKVKTDLLVQESNVVMVRAIVALQDAEIELLAEASAYAVPSPSQLKSKLRGESGGLTKHLVERLRKDFLMLMKNLKRAKNYEDAARIRLAVIKWKNHYDDIISQIRPAIEGLIRMDLGKEPWEKKANDGWAKEYRDKQSPIWSLQSDMGEFPMSTIEQVKSGIARYGYRGTSKEQLFAEYKKSFAKWDAKVKRHAREAWKWLLDLVAWTERPGMYGGGGEVLSVRYPKDDAEIQSMEGFSVQVRGFEDGKDEKYMGEFQRGLKHYRQRAKQLMPWLLSHKIPFILHFARNRRLMSNSAAATYSPKKLININIFGMHGQDGDVAKVLAHEMGHHLYQSVMSKKMKDDWHGLIKGSETWLDLRDAVKEMKPGESDWDFDHRIEKENPILSLQLATLYDDPRYKRLDLISMDQIKEYLDNGGDPKVRVPGKPISGYAAKNTEEAFCEALGLLVGHGPRALLPEIRAALQILFPRLKIEWRDRGLAAQLEEAFSGGHNPVSRPVQ